jgi:hypothetical protein
MLCVCVFQEYSRRNPCILDQTDEYLQRNPLLLPSGIVATYALLSLSATTLAWQLNVSIWLWAVVLHVEFTALVTFFG